jgi:hypothetical protein
MLGRRRNLIAQNFVLTPAQTAVLVQANKLAAAGQPGAAAPLFAQLAHEMESSNHPRRAANLHAQAAHAYADSQNEAAALTHSRAALSLFIQYKMVMRTPVFYGNITRKLRAKGFAEAADSLKREFEKAVGPVPAAQAAPAHAGRLPTGCPKCGAPVRHDEITWVDAQTAECPYCGTLLPAT